MAEVIKMPRLSDTMEEGVVAQWLKKVGDEVYEGDILEIDARVKQLVTECEKFADESPYPEKNIMYDSVYEQQNYPFLKHKPE